MKKKDTIIEELNELHVKSQVPGYAITELSSLMYEDMKITYALKFNSGTAITVIVLLWVVFSKPVLGVSNYLNELGSIGQVIKLMILCGIVFLPSIYTKSVVFTNTAIFVFSAHNSSVYSYIPYQDIKTVKIARSSLIIDNGNKKFKYSRLVGISKKKRDSLTNSINILLSDESSND